MSFLNWHYSQGFQNYLLFFPQLVSKIGHYFSLPILLQTLFYPYKRLVADKSQGFNLQAVVDQLTFNLISRIIGFMVRVVLLITCLFCLLLGTTFWFIGVFVWLVFPLIGFPGWLRYSDSSATLMQKLNNKLKELESIDPQTLFDNKAGRFVLSHTNFELNTLPPNNKILDQEFFFFGELLNWYFDEPDENNDLHNLVMAGFWWDHSQLWQEQSRKTKPSGFGAELLFGFTPHLNNYVTDMGQTQSFSQHLIGRKEVVKKMERVLTSGSSAFLIGEPGVGKKTVIYEFSKRAKNGELGLNLAYSRVLDLDYNSVLSQPGSLNEKKTRLGNIFLEAAYAGNVILVIKDFHRLIVADLEGWDFVGALENAIDQYQLKIIALTTPVEYERFLAPNTRLSRYFKPVEINPTTKEEALLILFNYAQVEEKKHNLILTAEVLRKVLDVSDKYITETPFPEKAVELLDQLIAHSKLNGISKPEPDQVEELASDKTGIPIQTLTQQQKIKLSNIEEFIHQHLVDQESAVSLIGKTLRSRTLGVKEDNKPVGSFLFLGPTGVGKTQTARALAQAYFGDQENIIRFDMAAYASAEGLTRLIGSSDKEKPGELTVAIKNKPASLLLLDEIEKAPREIINLLLTLLDEGYLIDALNKKINCRHLFIIATSNAGAEQIRKLVDAGTGNDDLQLQALEIVQQQNIFSAEFLNRFDGVIVYKPLREQDLIKIAQMMLAGLTRRLEPKRIKVAFDEAAVNLLVKKGYNPSLGARPMQRVVDLEVGDVISKGMLEGQISEGDSIIVTGNEAEEFEWQRIES